MPDRANGEAMAAGMGGTGRRAPGAPRREASLAHLSLPRLRQYRAELRAEETRVSYWRRLLLARADVVRAGTSRDDPSRLRDALADAPVLSRRQALIETVAIDDIPPLPDLAALWADPGDPSELLAALSQAERTLSAYRHALRARLQAATRDLVARYHEDPPLCLSALPGDPP